MKRVGAFIWCMLIRVLRSTREVLVWIDQAIALIITIPFYLIFGHPTPCARQTISRIVGFYAAQDYKWALVAEWFIDRLFYIPEGFRLGHCRKYVECDDIDWDNVSNHL